MSVTIFDPLGMTDTGFSVPDAEIRTVRSAVPP